ncbi:MAG TPA: GDSL-type esterase/lipase family protein [Bryobacteraceae bacterium]|nr:GDSL-type esterase/lipase family protein [Bryobacteraceae bacterium]
MTIHQSVIAALTTAAALWSQEPCSDRVQSLERQVAAQNRVMRDWGGLIRYGSDDSELPPPAAGEDRVVFLGDQITEFWTRTDPNFFAQKSRLNRGIAGQTTDQMLIRFRQDVIDLHPKAVVILAGLNDIAGLHGTATEEMIVDNLMSMSELARANGIRVVLASVTPVCDCFTNGTARRRWQERIGEVNELIAKYCARSGATFLNYFRALADDDNLKKQFTTDGVLPNDAGYRVMAQLAEKSVAEALAR